MIERAAHSGEGGFVVTDQDGRTRFVPDDPANRDRRKLAAWEKEGGVIAPAEPRPDPTPDPVIAKITDLEAAVAALKTAGVLTDVMIDAEKVATIEVTEAMQPAAIDG